jgi:nitrate reductase NapE
MAGVWVQFVLERLTGGKDIPSNLRVNRAMSLFCPSRCATLERVPQSERLAFTAWSEFMNGNVTHSESAEESVSPQASARERRRELFVFSLLAVLIWPFVAIGVVAGWGFVVWMYYMFTGPPGPV